MNVKRGLLSSLFFCILLFPWQSFALEIIAFGDSLTQGCYNDAAGLCGKEPSEYYAYGYPSYLQTFFNNDGVEAVVKNFGVGGEQTKDGLARITSVLEEPCNQGVGYVLLMEGTNDLMHHEEPWVVVYNLELMVDAIIGHGMQPVLATITPDPDATYKQIEELNALIRDLALQKDILLVEQYYSLVDNWYSYVNPPGCYGDQTHPNSLGFRDMAGVWYENLLTLPEFNPVVPAPWLHLLLSN